MMPPGDDTGKINTHGAHAGSGLSYPAVCPCYLFAHSWSTFLWGGEGSMAKQIKHICNDFEMANPEKCRLPPAWDVESREKELKMKAGSGSGRRLSG